MTADWCRQLMRSTGILSLRAQGFDRALMAEVAKETESSHLSIFSPVPVTHELALEIAFGVYDHYE
jgi:hypothetical protein